MLKEKISTTEAYIAHQPEPFRKTLQALRALIKSIVPEVEETISYGVPCFKYKYMLTAIGVNKKYCSLYGVSTELLKQLKIDVSAVKTAGSTLYFIPGEPLPQKLIEKIIKVKVKMNEERAIAKSKKK